ncbi:hypothetical protein RCL1_007749 [Eukaryota sp. TZLM3-RCL]
MALTQSSTPPGKYAKLSESDLVTEITSRRDHFSKLQSVYNEMDGILNDLARRSTEYFRRDNSLLSGANDSVQTIKTAADERENNQRVLSFLRRLLDNTSLPRSVLWLETVSARSLERSDVQSEFIESLKLLNQLLLWEPPKGTENTTLVKEFFSELHRIHSKAASTIYECLRSVLDSQFPVLVSTPLRTPEAASNLLFDAHKILDDYTVLLLELRNLDQKQVLPLLDSYSKLVTKIIEKRLIQKYPMYSNSSKSKSKIHNLSRTTQEISLKYVEFCSFLCDEICFEQKWFSNFFIADSEKIQTQHLLLIFDVARNILSSFVDLIVPHDVSNQDPLITAPLIVDFLSKTEEFISKYQDSVNAVPALFADAQLRLSQAYGATLDKYTSSIKSHRISSKRVGIVTPTQQIPCLIFSLAFNTGNITSSALHSVFDCFSTWLLSSTEHNRSCRIDNLAYLVKNLRDGFEDSMNSVIPKYVNHFDGLLVKEVNFYSKKLLNDHFQGIFAFVEHVKLLLPTLSNHFELRFEFGLSISDVLSVMNDFNSKYKSSIASIKKKISTQFDHYGSDILGKISEELIGCYSVFVDILTTPYNVAAIPSLSDLEAEFS